MPGETYTPYDVKSAFDTIQAITTSFQVSWYETQKVLLKAVKLMTFKRSNQVKIEKYVFLFTGNGGYNTILLYEFWGYWSAEAVH